MRVSPAEISRMARVAAAFVQRNEPALQEWVGINSFTENARGVNLLAERTAAWFAAAVDGGFHAHTQPSINRKYGNHLALVRRSSPPSTNGTPPKPTIALVSHLDTVYPEEIETLHKFRWDASTEKHPGGSWIRGPGSESPQSPVPSPQSPVLSTQRMARESELSAALICKLC